MNGVAVTLYSLIYLLELVESRRGIHRWLSRSDTVFKGSWYLGGMPLRDSESLDPVFTHCWTKCHRNKSYSYEQDDWKSEPYSTEEFSDEPVRDSSSRCYCAGLYMVMVLHRLVWAMRSFGNTIGIAVHISWVDRDCSIHRPVYSFSFDDFLRILIVFSSNKQPRPSI